MQEDLQSEKEPQLEEETIGEEISQADDNVSMPAEKTGKSPMIPIVVVVVVIAVGAGVILKKRKDGK